MRPVLKYRGGKWQEIPKFIKYIPTDYKCYIEPFFGGGALFFFLEPQNAIINDLNKPLMRFYAQLRDNYPLMRKQLDTLQHIYEKNQLEFKIEKLKNNNKYIKNKNEDLYYKLRYYFNYPRDEWLDGVIYFFINKTAYSGMIRYNNKLEYNVPFGRYKNFNTRLITTEHNKLLKLSKIYNTDYIDILSLAKHDDFIFLDPPYDCVFNNYGNMAIEDGFDEIAQRRLGMEFNRLECRCLMIIGKTKLTESIYKNYICGEYFKSYAVNIRNRFKNSCSHLIVKNY